MVKQKSADMRAEDSRKVGWLQAVSILFTRAKENQISGHWCVNLAFLGAGYSTLTLNSCIANDKIKIPGMKKTLERFKTQMPCLGQHAGGSLFKFESCNKEHIQQYWGPAAFALLKWRESKACSWGTLHSWQVWGRRLTCWSGCSAHQKHTSDDHFGEVKSRNV